MSFRLYAGSLMGLDRDKMHFFPANPFVRIFLDERVDRDRLSRALSEALKDCPYMNYSVTEDEGIFLAAKENDAPLPLLEMEPDIINSPENNGHSCTVSSKDNRISVGVTHALTDGCGFFFFVRTLLDRYFGEDKGIFRGSSEPDYAKDLLENDLPVSPGYVPGSLPEGSYFMVDKPVPPDFSNMFLLQTSYGDFRTLCKKLNASVQNVLTALCILAVSGSYLKSGMNVTARLPINARSVMGIPNTFQNASLANMRVAFTSESIGDVADMVREIASQCVSQNTEDAVAFQCNQWRKVLMAKDRDERLKQIIPLMGRDALLISNLGKGLISDSYAEHIIALCPGAMMFPLMVYGIPFGDRMGFSGYDGTGKGEYKKALGSVLERMGLSIEERDTATGKAV